MKHHHIAALLSLTLCSATGCSDVSQPVAGEDDERLDGATSRLFAQIPGDPKSASPSVAGRTVELHITNPWGAPTQVDVHTHHPTQNISVQTYELGPHATRVVHMAPRGVQSYQVELLSDAQVGAVVRTQWRGSDGNVARAMHNAVSVIDSNVQYCGEIAYIDDGSPKQRAELTVSNLTGVGNTATVEFFEGSSVASVTKSIPLTAYETVTLSSDALGLPLGTDNRWIGSAKVTGSGNVTASVNKINRNNGTAYNCTSSGGTEFSFPEFKQRRKQGRWRQWNVASIQNIDSAPVTVTATFSDGTVENKNLDPNARWALNAINGYPKAVTNEVDFNGTLDVTTNGGHVAVLNTTQIRRSGDDEVDYPRGGQYALPTADEVGTRLVFPLMSLQDPYGAYEFGHVTLYNPHPKTDAKATIRFYDRNGVERFEDAFDVPATGNTWYNNKYNDQLREALRNELLEYDFDGSILVESDLPLQGVMQGLTRDQGQVNTSALIISGGPAGATSETRHLDAIVDALSTHAPDLERVAWARSAGNAMQGHGHAGEWLLQTPDCWGDAVCTDPQGPVALADNIYADLAAATQWVDIATLSAFPDGEFQDAIVGGLKQALSQHPNLTIRIMGGTVPLPATEKASEYYERLQTDLGAAAVGARFIVAGTRTSSLYSWNHAKIIAVDSRTAIVGGHNLWSATYGVGVEDPVSDVSMRLRGPASDDAHRFADELWGTACTDAFAGKRSASDAMGDECPATHTTSAGGAVGGVDVLALGGLGYGIPVPSDGFTLPPVDDDEAACSTMLTDYFNDDEEFLRGSAETIGLHALVASAAHEVFISQQDLLAICGGPLANSRYDARLFDILADKMLAGVSVQIVLSSPGASQGSGTSYAPYSNGTPQELSAILLRKVAERGGLSNADAKAVVCHHLQLASIRVASGVQTWPNGRGIANHAKVVAVDGEAMYVGSKNLYPTVLQDFGYVIEDSAAAAAFESDYRQPLWNQSRGSATVDFETEHCEP